MNPGANSGAAIGKAILLAIIGVCVLGACGQNGPTIWKVEARFPDGLWTASARTIQNGGFGTASIDTVVYLKRTKVSEPPMQVLGFSCKGPAPRPYRLDDANAGGTINLQMKWVTPSHLEVTYDGNAGLYFQVVKFAGIDISVRDLSSTTTSSSE